MSADYNNVVCFATYLQQKEERELQESLEYLQAWAKYYAEELPPDIVGMILTCSLEEHLAGERI